MKYEIMENTSPVSYNVATVDFPAYEVFKEKAIDISEEIRAMNVDPENIKEAKTMLAEARKITDRLSRVRIDIKKEILAGYQTFEAQVKEISAIIGDADDALRAKVRELEEAERQAKKEALRMTWDMRIDRFPYVRDYLKDPFERWLTQKHLNKTVSMKKAEADMVKWLEQEDLSLQSAEAMGEDFLTEYILTGSWADAVQNVKARETIRDTVNASEQEELEEVTAWFLIRGTKDIKLVEMLLKENEINFERK